MHTSYGGSRKKSAISSTRRQRYGITNSQPDCFASGENPCEARREKRRVPRCNNERNAGCAKHRETGRDARDQE